MIMQVFPKCFRIKFIALQNRFVIPHPNCLPKNENSTDAISGFIETLNEIPERFVLRFEFIPLFVFMVALASLGLVGLDIIFGLISIPFFALFLLSFYLFKKFRKVLKNKVKEKLKAIQAIVDSKYNVSVISQYTILWFTNDFFVLFQEISSQQIRQRSADVPQMNPHILSITSIVQANDQIPIYTVDQHITVNDQNEKENVKEENMRVKIFDQQKHETIQLNINGECTPSVNHPRVYKIPSFQKIEENFETINEI